MLRPNLQTNQDEPRGCQEGWTYLTPNPANKSLYINILNVTVHKPSKLKSDFRWCQRCLVAEPFYERSVASITDLIGPIPSRSGNPTKNEDEGIAQLLTNAVNEFWGDRIDQWLDTILRGNVRECVQDLKDLSEQIIFAFILY